MTEQQLILVVDDDHDLRRTICDFLSANAYRVQQAGDGHNALSLIESEIPAVVITDVFMPDKEGISTIMEIRQEHEDIKIIAMSGGGQFRRLDLLYAAENLGANIVMAKPFDFYELLAAIKKLVPPIHTNQESSDSQTDYII